MLERRALPAPGPARCDVRVGETFDPWICRFCASAGRGRRAPAAARREPRASRRPAARLRRGHLPGVRVVRQRRRVARRPPEVGPLAVGTMLAAAGTALPESVVTLVAVLFGGPATGFGHRCRRRSRRPAGGEHHRLRRHRRLLLLLRRRSRLRSGRRHAGRRPTRWPASSALPEGAPGAPPTATAPDGDELAGIDTARLARDQTWFLVIFVVMVALGLVAFAIKPWFGWLLLRRLRGVLPARGVERRGPSVG